MSTLLKSLVPVFAVFLILTARSAIGQDDEQAPPVPVKAFWSTTAIAVGGASDLAVVFDVPKGHHITDVEYGLFIVQTFDTLGLDFGDPIFPRGTPLREERAYRGRTVVRVPMLATDSAVTGAHSWPIVVSYQICQEFGQEVCFLPEERTITVVANVVAKGTAVESANAEIFAPPTASTEATSLEQRLIAALERGSWLAFVIVFIGGILTSFTPCVYPVIPITIGYIGGSSGGKPLRGLALSAIFALGIAIVYSSLGLFAAATGSLFGAMSGSPIVNIIIAIVFMLMGLSMLGAFDIALPSALQTSLTGGGARRGFFGPLLLGMASGLIMAPCVGPVIVALLAWVAKSGNLFYGWALLFTFSFGLGLLFLVIGTFAGAIQALPRAGAWMEIIKKSFGWILIGGALFVLRFALPPTIYWLAWSILLIVFAVFAGAFDSLSKDAGAGHRLWKAVALFVFLVGAIFLLRAIGPFGERTVDTKAEGVSWMINEEEKAIAAARDGDQPMIVDVYADWCAACVELDEKTYVVPDVVRRLDDFVRLKLDFTSETPWVRDMKAKYKITGMPTVIFYDPSGREVSRFTGFKPAKDFLALLDRNSL